MKDYRKFCRPKTTKYPQVGDVQVKLNCGSTVYVKAKDYLSIKKSFKINSIIGETSNTAGNIKVLDKELNEEITVSPETYINNQNKFEFIEIVRNRYDPTNGHKYVDLGLPSGTKWATMNVGASSETDYGNYYQYGKGAAQYVETSGDSDYNGTENPLAASADTAAQMWGGSWHMPTRAQMEELTANTAYQWVTNYKGSGINGGTFTATNGAVLFIPAAGFWSNGSQYYVGVNGIYWGSSPNGGGSAYNLGFNNGSKDVVNFNREYGCSVRPVDSSTVVPEGTILAQDGDIITHNNTLNQDAIFSFNDWLNLTDDWDLVGLYGITTYEEENAVGGDYVIMANGHTLIIKPEDYSKVSNNWEVVDTISVSQSHDYVEIGGIKWATMNVGANSITDTGLYFQWGDTQGYTAEQVGSGEGQKYFDWTDYKYNPSGDGETFTKYNNTDSKTVLEASDDAVTAAWGGNWRMPTAEEFYTLNDAANYDWTDDYQGSGVAGIILTSNTDNSKKLFFPAADFAIEDMPPYLGSNCGYWCSSLSDNYNFGAYCFYYNSGDLDWNFVNSRYYGYTVRGVLDE